MNHDGVRGDDLLDEFHVVQENTDIESDGDMESATELEINSKVGHDGDMKGNCNILQKTIDVQSPILAVSQEPQFHDFNKENHVLNETLVIKSPSVPTRVILGPLRANVTAGGSSGDNPIEAEVITVKKESEEKARHDKLVREEMNRFGSNVISIHPAQEIPMKQLPEKIKAAGLKPFKVTIKKVDFMIYILFKLNMLCKLYYL